MFDVSLIYMVQGSSVLLRQAGTTLAAGLLMETGLIRRAYPFSHMLGCQCKCNKMPLVFLRNL